MKSLLAFAGAFLISFGLFSQVKTPEQIFGFKPGADYKLAKYDQMLEFYQQLVEGSDRVAMEEIGKTVLGKPMVLLAISSEENIANLEKYRSISESLARVSVDENTAQKYSEEGKAIIWIDGGLHATEVAGAQMTPELAYRVATEESAEMQNIRENVIMLLMPVMNPDGLDIIADWYYRNVGTTFETTRPPWLYHHYIGHDNNRDWFMNNMPESYHVNDAIYRKWYPQIVYNHHQTSPAWARIFLPPFSNPVNPRIHPGTTTATNLIGTVMANRFAMKKMPGVISYQTFSMWWNGGMRTVPYYHNMVGILTETAHASPSPRYYDPKRKPSSIGGRRGGMASDGTQIFYPYPWEGGESKFRDAVDYMLTGTMAVLDFAADRRQEYLINIYRMGQDAIEGNLLGEHKTYILSADQPQFSEVINLTNILIRGGLEVHQLTKKATLGETDYPKGSFVISTKQSFRPYLEDLMERQDYPDQFLYPGGPPNPPYDLAGWTLPMQMGIDVDVVDGDVSLSTEKLEDLISLEGSVSKGKATNYVLPANDNYSFKAVNLLLAGGSTVSVAEEASEGVSIGDFIIDGASDVEAIAKSSGATFVPTKSAPNSRELSRSKVGLYKSWVSNMDEGWTRWLLTQYAFDWDTLHDADIQSKDLSQYDAIILPSQNANSIKHGHREGTMPEEFTGGLGSEGTFQLQKYVESGGRLITFDAAGNFAIENFGLPIRNVTQGQSPQSFFIPGSLIRSKVDTSHPLASGMNEEVAVSFSRSSAYSVVKRSYTGEGGDYRDVKRGEEPNVTTIVSYADNDLLMSGWALGEERVLKGRAAMVEVPVGSGSIILFGFRPQFRGQPRGTYKLLFNSLMK